MLIFGATILVNTAFGLIVRAAQRAGVNVLAAGVVNYIFASSTFWVVYWLLKPPAATGALSIGAVAGSIYFVAYLLLLPAMQLRGVAIALAFVRLSVIIPLAAAMLIWREAPDTIKTCGIVLALLALPLLSLDRGVSSTRLTGGNIALLMSLFFVNGTCLLMSKWFQSTGLVAQRPLYLATVFCVAGLGLTVAWMITRCEALGYREIGWGIAIGAANAGSNLLILYTLDMFLASVMFPILAAVGLSLATVFAALAWREIPGRLGWSGIVIAVAAIILANR